MAAAARRASRHVYYSFYWQGFWICDGRPVPLRETERDIAGIGQLIFVGWISLEVVLLVLVGAMARWSGKEEQGNCVSMQPSR